MSAYQLDRKHFVAIGAFILAHGGEHTGGGHVSHPGTLWAYDRATCQSAYYPAHAVATILQEANADSILARYSERPETQPVIIKELPAATIPTVGQMNGILRSLSYQSCEVDDWYNSFACTLINRLRELVLDVVSREEQKRLGITDTTGTTYEWAN
jgi:hypothetical protein